MQGRVMGETRDNVIEHNLKTIKKKRKLVSPFPSVYGRKEPNFRKFTLATRDGVTPLTKLCPKVP